MGLSALYHIRVNPCSQAMASGVVSHSRSTPACRVSEQSVAAREAYSSRVNARSGGGAVLGSKRPGVKPIRVKAASPASPEAFDVSLRCGNVARGWQDENSAGAFQTL